MAVHKIGLDYFPMDINFFSDEKIEFVAAKFEELGELIAVKLLSRIYREGYFLEWDDDKALLFAMRSGPNISYELVKNVVEELINRKFLDSDLFEKHNILTSRGIQTRYLEAVKRRKQIKFYRELSLISEHDVNKICPNANIVSLNDDISKQSKVKESKVKYNPLNPPSRKNCPYQKIFDLYSLNCPDLNPLPNLITDDLKKRTRARWLKQPDLEWFDKYFKYVSTVPFLNGKNNRGWKASFNWLMGPQNMTKVLSREYEDNPVSHGTIQPKTYRQAQDLETRELAESIKKDQERMRHAENSGNGTQEICPVLQ